ncbi:MAG TPA: 5-methyltetrahydropteroyltriglutamate--homocysteine S-methyltransferase [Candidatus Binatia bacterium]|jgi:5-methyltetrahydropteroyltriglutamate--homocysteine methyltransferase|nr:5-methyltetrahydropteroyltriglutamate--homocysteine S-methyltransferase [Candidatus Binatia bacterium]
MAAKKAPPFRAEHIGSLLRPPELLAARRAFDEGTLAIEALRIEEDRWIKQAVAVQESLGLKAITDGEYRRLYYFGHFPAAVSGFTEMEAELSFQNQQGEKLRYLTPVVTGKLRRLRGVATDEFTFVQSLTSRTVKVTLPSPCSQHYFRWREGISERAYPDLDEFFTDVTRIYQQELTALSALGATYVQLDDVSLPLLCDAKLREGFKARGYDPDTMLGKYIAVVNESLRDRSASLTVGMHLCRGNNQGQWLGEGSYEFVAEQVFNRLQIDVFFLEYDSPRAGSFAPLQYVPQDKTIVLGLVSTKSPVLESADDLRRRIDEASRFVPLERLALSPQCGFASTAPGNPITPADQEKKLRLVTEVAGKIWG